MRIIAGNWRGRQLRAPQAGTTRPTADRVRQALFDMLAHAPWARPWPECRVLDAFAGTGALGLEALSRGAVHATFFETDPRAAGGIRANIAALGAGGRTLVLGDATRPPAAGAAVGCNLVFLDPPYATDLLHRALTALGQSGWIAPDALVVSETARTQAAPVPADRLLAQRSHGAACLSIWRLTDL